MSIAIVCFPNFEVINLKINFIFLTKQLFNMSKKPRQKFKYLENKKSS